MPNTTDLIEGFKALDETVLKYERLWTYYAGDLPEKFASEQIRIRIERTSREYKFRLARIPVESLANRLGINSITSTDAAATREIEAIRQANDMDLIEPFLTERLLTFGDAYMLVWPKDEEDVDDTENDVIAAGVELAYQSPLSCRAFYTNDDGRHLRYTIRRWKIKGPLGEQWRAECFYSDRVESWISNPGSKGQDAAEWEMYAEDEAGDRTAAIEGQNWPEEHDFGENPMKHARTDLPYGRSEIEDFIGPQNAISKATATQATGIESHGWHERWRIADDKAVLEQASDTVPWGDAADAPKATTTPVSGRRWGAGMEHLFHGTKAVGEYSPTDLGAMIDPIEQWVRLGAAASATPLFEFDARTGQQMTGVARERAERPLAAKEEDRKRFLLRFWREVYGLALDMRNVPRGDITVNWSPPKVNNDPEWWNTATIRRGFGVPERTILMEANYTVDQIEKWEDEQDDALLMDSKIARLASLGEALSALGTGAQLLGLPNDTVAKLVEDILGGPVVLEEKEPQEPPEEMPGDGEVPAP